MPGQEHRGARKAPLLFSTCLTRALLWGALLAALPSGAWTQEPGPPLPDGPGEHGLLRPDTVFRIPRGPQVVMFQTPGSPLVSLRLMVPITEGPVEAGSAGILLRLRLDAVRSLARRIAARVDGSRTRQGLAYSISGTAHDFDHLAWLARRAVADPRPDRSEVAGAVQAGRRETEKVLETAEARLRDRLRGRVWPSRPPPEGTPASLDRISPASLRDFWARSHQADHMTLIVVGAVEPVQVLAAFQEIGAPPQRSGGPLQGGLPAQPRPRDPQIIRTWYGQAFVLGDGSDPRPTVAAALMAEALQNAPNRLEGTVELWEAGPVSALIVIAAAYRREADAMRRTIRQLPRSTAQALDAQSLGRTVARVRADFLFGARTPWGLASLVGHFAQDVGDPGSGERFLEALDALDVEGMAAFLLQLQSGSPIREELRP